MKKYTPHFALLAPVTAAFVFVISGCASPTYERADATVLSLQASTELIQETRAQLSSLSDSLALLKRNEELAKHYADFSAQVALFERSASKIAASALAMQSKGAAYFSQWQKDLDKIDNPTLRHSSNDRLTQVSAGFASIKRSYDTTTASFAPLLIHLKDIKTALGADLTPAGAASVRPFIDYAYEDIEPVKRALENLAADFSTIGVSLGSVAKGTP